MLTLHLNLKFQHVKRKGVIGNSWQQRLEGTFSRGEFYKLLKETRNWNSINKTAQTLRALQEGFLGSPSAGLYSEWL